MVIAAALAITTASLMPAAPRAQQPQEIPFDAEVDFLKLPPGVYMGEAAGVAVNSRGNIFVYSRTGAPGHIIAPQAATIWEFAPDGSFIRELGQNLYSKAWAHAVRIDSQDNIWLVDNGSDMVVKM